MAALIVFRLTTMSVINNTIQPTARNIQYTYTDAKCVLLQPIIDKPPGNRHGNDKCNTHQLQKFPGDQQE